MPPIKIPTELSEHDFAMLVVYACALRICPKSVACAIFAIAAGTAVLIERGVL